MNERAINSPGAGALPRLYDAHNHLQDSRLTPYRAELLAAVERDGIRKMVVNGSCEEDWDEVAALARGSDVVLPSFGYHPWYVKERSSAWQKRLSAYLEEFPAGVGEIGLDRWLEGYDLEDQAEVFSWQLRLAAERNLPVSIHCLKAWGRLLDLLRAEPRPACGFLLHSFGGPVEMIEELTELGAYFSLPGYFAHERKVRQREAFRHVPRHRFLIETDAPDQLLPDHRSRFALRAASGQALNHPGNLSAVYDFAAELFRVDVNDLAAQVEQNFLALFGSRLSELSRRTSAADTRGIEKRSLPDLPQT